MSLFLGQNSSAPRCVGVPSTGEQGQGKGGWFPHPATRSRQGRAAPACQVVQGCFYSSKQELSCPTHSLSLVMLLEHSKACPELY